MISRKHLLQRYGLTMEQFNNLLAKQRGRCAICRCDRCPTFGRLSVDHDHTNSVVRGLLCDPCNKALGLFHDNLHFLKRALLYLQKATK